MANVQLKDSLAAIQNIADVRSFGVVADGSADDTAALLTALAWVKANNGELCHSKGTMNLSGWSSAYSLDFPLRMHFSGGASAIVGPGETVDLFSLTAGGSVHIDSGDISGFRRVVSVAAGFTTTGEIKLDGGVYHDNVSVFWAGTAANGTISVRLNSVEMHGNYVDFDAYRVNNAGVWADNCYFHDGGPESLNFSLLGGKTGKAYFFANCRWENYTNDRTGGDADGHFVRAYGSSAKFINCTFDGLYCTGESGVDTEGLRMATDDLQVIGCRFKDAGLQEGTIVNKVGARTRVSNSTFEVTAEYLAFNAVHTTTGSCPASFSGATDTVYSDCDFVGYNKPIEFTGGGDAGLAMFDDCRFTDYSGSRLVSVISGTSVHLVFANCKSITTDGTAAGLTDYVVFAQGAGNGMSVEFIGCALAFTIATVMLPSNGATGFRYHLEGGSVSSPSTVSVALINFGGTDGCVIDKMFIDSPNVLSSVMPITRGTETNTVINEWDVDYSWTIIAAADTAQDAFYLGVGTGCAAYAMFEYTAKAASVSGSYAHFRGELAAVNDAGTLAAVAGTPADLNIKASASSTWGSGVFTTATSPNRLRGRVGASATGTVVSARLSGRSKLAA